MLASNMGALLPWRLKQVFMRRIHYRNFLALFFKGTYLCHRPCGAFISCAQLTLLAHQWVQSNFTSQECIISNKYWEGRPVTKMSRKTSSCWYQYSNPQPSNADNLCCRSISLRIWPLLAPIFKPFQVSSSQYSGDLAMVGCYFDR